MRFPQRHFGSVREAHQIGIFKACRGTEEIIQSCGGSQVIVERGGDCLESFKNSGRTYQLYSSIPAIVAKVRELSHVVVNSFIFCIARINKNRSHSLTDMANTSKYRLKFCGNMTCIFRDTASIFRKFEIFCSHGNRNRDGSVQASASQYSISSASSIANSIVGNRTSQSSIQREPDGQLQSPSYAVD